MCKRIEHIIELENFAMLEVDGHAICNMYRMSETKVGINLLFGDTNAY